MTNATFISEVRTHIKDMLSARHNLKAKIEENAAGSIIASLTDPDFSGNSGNTDLNQADMIAAFQALAALENLLIDPETKAPTVALTALLKFK